MKDLKIKVIGIGNGGQDAVDYLYLNNKCKNIDFIVINSDERILKSIKKMAEETGIVILTDSDSAGFKIRNYKAPHVCDYFASGRR